MYPEGRRSAVMESAHKPDVPVSKGSAAPKVSSKKALNKPFHWGLMLLLVTLFQLFSFFPVAFSAGEMNETLCLVFGVYIAAEWVYLALGHLITQRDDFALEILAFFLSGIGLTICGSIYETYALKQLIAIGLGLLGFTVLTWLLRSTERAMFLRMPLAFLSIGLLAVNLLLAQTTNGALNWITIGSFSFQPSELVKVGYIYVGAAAMDKLSKTFSTHSVSAPWSSVRLCRKRNAANT